MHKATADLILHFYKPHKPLRSARRRFLLACTSQRSFTLCLSQQRAIDSKFNIEKKCFQKMALSSPALTVSGVTYHSERQHSTLDLKPSQAPSIKPPHLGWKRLSKELSLGFNENQMLWAQLSCFLSRTTEQPLLQFHQEPCPSFPSSSALLSVPNQNQIKSSWPKRSRVLPKYCYWC